MEKYRNSIGDDLGNLIGSQGVKLSVNIAPAAIPVLVISIITSIIVGSIASHYIIKALSK